MKNSVYYLLGEIFLRGVNLILTPIYIHSLSIDEFGLLGLLIATYTILQKILNLGFQSAFTRFSRIKEDNELSSTVWIHSIFSIAILIIIAIIFSNYYKEYVSSISLIFVIFTIVLRSSVTNNLVALMKSRGKAINVGLVGLSGGVTTLAVISIMFYQFRAANISSIIFANAFGALVSAVIAVILYSSTIFQLPSLKVFRELWDYSHRLTFHGFNQWAIVSGDRFLIKYVIGISALGEYFLLYQFPLIGHMIFRAINSSLMPSYTKLALKLDPLSLARNHNKLLISINSLYIFVCVCSLGFKYFDISMLSVFSNNYNYIPVLFSTSCYFGLYYIPMNYYTLVLGKTRYISFISTFVVINGFLINWFLLDTMNINASIVAVWSSTLLLAILTFALVVNRPSFKVENTIKYYLLSIINISIINSLFYFGVI